MTNEAKAKKMLQAAKELELENGEEALALINKSLGIAPNYIPSLIALSLMLQDRNLWEESIAAAMRITKLDSTKFAAYSLLGHAYSARKEFQKAFDAFSTAAKFRPSSARYVLAGDMSSRLGDDAQAAECYRKALALDKDDDEAMFNLAVLLRSSDRIEAKSLLWSILELDPSNAAALRELGFLLTMTDPEEAGVILRKSLSIEDNSWGHIYLAVALFTLEEFDEADKEYLLGHELDPENGALELAANAYERCGDYDKAAEYRVRAASLVS